MKVAFCSPDNNASSGAFLSMANLALQLERMGVDTIIVLPNRGNCAGPGDGVKILKEYGLRYYMIDSWSWVIPVNYKNRVISFMVKWKNRVDRLHNIKAIFKLYKLIKKEKIDFLHINNLYSYYGIYAAKKAGIPVIWHIREFLEEDQIMHINEKNRGYKLIDQSDRIIAISQSVYEKYSRILDKRKINIVYNGIDTEKFYNGDHTILNQEVIRFVYVGGLSEGKGVIELIKACKLLNENGYKDKYEMYVAGRGSNHFQKYIQDFIERYEMSNVILLGYVKDICHLLDSTDVSVITSHAEAFGRTTVEAMLTGNLVIGADSAGTRELLHDGQYGIMFKTACAENLAEKMKYVFSNREECKKKATEARSYMNINMTAKKNAEEIYKIYVELEKEKKI